MSSGIPPAVEQFIVEHLRSLEHLDALLHLQRHAMDWWTPQALAVSIGVTVHGAEQILEELCSANLLDVRVASAVSYQFSPGSAEAEQLALDLVDALRRERPRVYTLITSQSARAMRDFADAFRWRGRNRG